eukprot:Seg5378.3 transcript_id=Seg5378.3/GoldUCD/mRNA.D3Y31 product="ADP-ribosylation factor 2-B" protein_id=Seg5378.3/GoldUCD/D3Y31
MADNTEPTADEEMVAVQEKTEEEEKPTTDVEELKKAVAQDAAKTEADESAKSGAEDENAKAANNEQDEEEEYVLKDEAHEEEDNQKENEVWDIGGQDKIRNLWRVYLKGSQGLIFVIDSSDKQRLEEAKGELHRLLEEEDLQGAHVLVFANKQDVVGAASVADVRDKLGLNNIRTHNWFIQPTCALKGEGLNDGLDWLANQIQGPKK